MTTRKKIISIALAACIAVTAAIGATLAYLTDKDEAANTFTVGHVDIDLTDTSPENGDYVRGEEVPGGVKYTGVKPGITYSKDVNVTVEPGSEDCYLFVELEFTNTHNLWASINKHFAGQYDGNPTGAIADILLTKKDAGIINDNIVAFKNDDTANGGTYSVVYKYGIKEAGYAVKLFDGVKIPGEFTNDDIAKLDGINLNVKAHAIQSDGLTETQAISELLLKNGYTDIANHPMLQG